MGDVPLLVSRIPVKHVVDHGPLESSGKGVQTRYQAYAEARDKIGHIPVKPGDRIPLKGVDVLVVASATKLIESPLARRGRPQSAVRLYSGEAGTHPGSGRQHVHRAVGDPRQVPHARHGRSGMVLRSQADVPGQSRSGPWMCTRSAFTGRTKASRRPWRRRSERACSDHGERSTKRRRSGHLADPAQRAGHAGYLAGALLGVGHRGDQSARRFHRQSGSGLSGKVDQAVGPARRCIHASPTAGTGSPGNTRRADRRYRKAGAGRWFCISFWTSARNGSTDLAKIILYAGQK